jgi:protoporphyrinogen oxidase
VMPNPRPLANQAAASWLKRWMGGRAFEVVWGPLLHGKFHQHAESIAMPWFWARIHDRSADLGYLRGGFQQLYDRWVERIEQLGGKVVLGCAATSIRSDQGGVRVGTTGEPRSYDRLIVTLPTRLFLRLASELPADYRERYEHGAEHLSAHCLVLALDRPLTEVYWLNVNDPGFPFLSLVEHTNFMPPEDYGGRHLVYLGNYLPADHRIFAMSREALLEEYLPHLKRINQRFEPDWVRESWSFSAPFAQPIVRVGYPSTLPRHQTPLRGVYLANMGHVYPQDRGQNYSLLLGERIAALCLSG